MPQRPQPRELTPEELADWNRVRARIPQHAVYRSLASETVMLNIATGMYYGLNQTAGRMLEVVEAAPRLADARQQLIDELDAPEVQVTKDMWVLCNDLGGRGLLEFVLVEDESK